VLNAAQHRGTRNWHYDGKQARIMPEAWDEAEYPPIFTAFEAVSVARRLVEIGAHCASSTATVSRLGA
jgi:hypothetical protein